MENRDAEKQELIDFLNQKYGKDDEGRPNHIKMLYNRKDPTQLRTLVTLVYCDRKNKKQKVTMDGVLEEVNGLIESYSGEDSVVFTDYHSLKNTANEYLRKKKKRKLKK